MESGKLWPIHLKPQDDELLSSWMIRMAHAHGLKVMTFSTLLFGYRRPVWNRDIDRLAPKDVLDKLSQITGTPSARVFATTLRELEGKAFEKFNLTGNTHWILPLGIHSRSRKGYGLQYCPKCLLEDHIPYFRRSWRLGFVTVCVKHRTVLSDCCEACGAPVTPHRVDMRSRTEYPTERDMLSCVKCGTFLTSSRKSTRATNTVCHYQNQWEEAVRGGWISWAGNPSMYSHIFFEGLRVMCSGLVSTKDRDRITAHLMQLKKIVKEIPEIGIEFSRVHTRYELIRDAVVLFDKWPEQFIKLMRESGFRYSTLHGYGKNVPYWYEFVINSELKFVCSPVNRKLQNKQREAVLEDIYLNASDKKGSIHDSRFSEYTQANDIYEAFLASIDHEIAGSKDKKERYELLRDKVMFAVGRTFGLTLEELSELTIEDVRKIVRWRVMPRFFQGPRGFKQGRAWCEWYFENIRPKFQPSEDENRLFISMENQSVLDPVSIHNRFMRAVRMANLRRYIKSYTRFVSVTAVLAC